MARLIDRMYESDQFDSALVNVLRVHTGLPLTTWNLDGVFRITEDGRTASRKVHDLRVGIVRVAAHKAGFFPPGQAALRARPMRPLPDHSSLAKAANGGSGGKLVLEWRETGGPPLAAPNAPGFGTSVIRDLIPYELGGAVDYELAPEGARCRLEIPAKWLSTYTFGQASKLEL